MNGSCGKITAGPWRPWLASLLVFTITTATCWAQDDETPTDTDDGTHPAKTLAAQAGDPTAPVLQFQVTNFLAPSSYNSDGYANLLNFQPVIPIQRTEKFPLSQVMRLTVPVITTPGPNRKTGLGDISFFDLFVPKPHSWGMWGAGVTMVTPTASNDELGQGKWQLGPAATLVYYKVPNWQLGGVIQNPISITGDNNRASVSTFQFQPLVNYLKGDWYFGVGDFNWTYDWKANDWTIPFAFQAGRITRIGKHSYNLSVELAWTAVRPDNSVAPKWGIRLGMVLMLPE